MYINLYTNALWKCSFLESVTHVVLLNLSEVTIDRHRFDYFAATITEGEIFYLTLPASLEHILKLIRWTESWMYYLGRGRDC